MLQLLLRIFYPSDLFWLVTCISCCASCWEIVVVVLGTVGFAGSCLVCVCNAMMMGDNIMEGLITMLLPLWANFTSNLVLLMFVLHCFDSLVLSSFEMACILLSHYSHTDDRSGG